MDRVGEAHESLSQEIAGMAFGLAGWLLSVTRAYERLFCTIFMIARRRRAFVMMHSDAFDWMHEY